VNGILIFGTNIDLTNEVKSFWPKIFYIKDIRGADVNLKVIVSYKKTIVSCGSAMEMAALAAMVLGGNKVAVDVIRTPKRRIIVSMARNKFGEKFGVPQIERLKIPIITILHSQITSTRVFDINWEEIEGI